jgi:thiol-disulfide isomerase/thioredoxin
MEHLAWNKEITSGLYRVRAGLFARPDGEFSGRAMMVQVAVKIAKAAVLLAAAAVLVFLLAPGVRTQFGSVAPGANRRAMESFSVPVIGDASRWNFDEHKGQVILLNFWATWCPPCRAETPELVELHKEFNGRGFSVVGVTVDDDPQSVVPQFMKEFNVPYPVLIPAGFERAARTDTLPTSLLIDKQGRIARTYTGRVFERVLRRDVEALLNE